MTCAICFDHADRDYAHGCACDHPDYPPCDPIPAGLSALPPQALGFPQIREALLDAVGRRGDLSGWTAREGDDLGVMLLESWAYVLDIVHFYNRRHQARGFLSTAPDVRALQRIVALIGYRPRPATGGSVTVAAIAGAKGPALLPAGLQVRSQSVPGIPAQVFEVKTDAVADPRTNEWRTAPRRPANYAGVVAFAPGAPGLAVGQVVAITVGGAATAAARVAGFAGQKMLDGRQYRVATFDPPPPAGVSGPLAQIAVFGMAQWATPTTFTPSPAPSPAPAASRTEWILDSVYPQIAAGDLVVVETPGGTLAAQKLTGATSADIEIGTSGHSVIGKATKITLTTAAEVRRVHFRATPAGALINPADQSIAVADLDGATLALETPVAALAGAAAPDQLLLGDTGDAGALFGGAIVEQGMGAATAQLGTVADAAATRLALPATVRGNLVELTRGQTVANEVLGSADASKPFQRFRLARKPLTYFPDPAHAGTLRPELEVRVNGLLWSRVDSFLGAPRGQQVYVVRHTPDGDAEIVFGDTVRPPSGVRNVTARYRYGAGALSPPPGKLTQLVGKVPNLARLIAPLAVRGGSDAEALDTIRRAAPGSTLASDRAVSLADYTALVGGYPGVIAASVDWAWVPGVQRAGIRAWIVCDGGDVSIALAAALGGAGDPLTSVTVTAASAVTRHLVVDLAIDPVFVASDVATSVRQALTDPVSGLLSPRRMGIGGAVFRSRIAAATGAIPGVAAIRAITVDGADMPAAIQADQGKYYAFDVVVGAS